MALTEKRYGDSLYLSGSAAAPALNATFVSTTVVAGAIYRVRVGIYITGTAETQLRNLTFRNNAVAAYSLPTITDKVVVVELPRVTAAGTTFDLRVLANATAGSFYAVDLAATRIE